MCYTTQIFCLGLLRGQCADYHKHYEFNELMQWSLWWYSFHPLHRSGRCKIDQNCCVFSSWVLQILSDLVILSNLKSSLGRLESPKLLPNARCPRLQPWCLSDSKLRRLFGALPGSDDMLATLPNDILWVKWLMDVPKDSQTSPQWRVLNLVRATFHIPRCDDLLPTATSKSFLRYSLGSNLWLSQCHSPLPWRKPAHPPTFHLIGRSR